MQTVIALSSRLSSQSFALYFGRRLFVGPRLFRASVAARSVVAPPPFAQSEIDQTGLFGNISDFSMPSGRPSEFTAPPVREGIYPKTALMEFFQKMIRGPPQLQYTTQATRKPDLSHGPWFTCALRTPSVNTTVNGAIIEIPEMVCPHNLGVICYVLSIVLLG